MFTKWTQHLRSDKDRENFTKSLKNSKIILERLHDILKQEEETLSNSETKVSAYETPNWAYLQADKNGYRRGLQFVKTLINLDQQKDI